MIGRWCTGGPAYCILGNMCACARKPPTFSGAVSVKYDHNGRAYHREDYDPDWKRKSEWRRRAGQDAIDRAGVCQGGDRCRCPNCREFVAMRARAREHYKIGGISWATAWTLAGWRGPGASPYCNPNETKVFTTSNPHATGGWLEQRFNEAPIDLPDFLPKRGSHAGIC